MERIIKYCSAFMALLILLPLAACTRPGDGNTTDSVADTTIEETGENIDMTNAMFYGGKAYYSLEPDNRTGLLNAREITLANNVAESFFGVPFNGEEHKILLKFEGTRFNWSITYDEASGDVTITAGEDVSMQRAIYSFLSYVIENASSGNLFIGPSLEKSFDKATDDIDNSSLLEYIPTDKVKLIQSNASGSLMTPEWVESMIMVELRPDIASIGGKLQDCKDLVDFYAAMGVNALWLCPIYERGTGGNGYGNTGPHKVDPVFTGTSDTDEGWKVVAEFVEYAHSKGIYILFDVITWGVMKGSELTVAHPTWFSGEAWGNAAFNWGNAEFKEWFITTCVNNILTTGADGFRCDCEPFTSGYNIFGEIRSRLAAQGKYIVVMSEDGSDRSKTYELEQDGVLKYAAMTRGEYYQKPVSFYVDGYLNIVDSVKTGEGIGYQAGQQNVAKRGTAKYYTNCISNHDFEARNILGNRNKIGYAAILAPFIPVWFMGDGFNASTSSGVQYFKKVSYGNATSIDNYYFFNDVKRYIEIRRTYGDIFAYWPDNHRESNIAEVKVEGLDKLQSYARFADGNAIIVIPSAERDVYTGKVSIPFDECGLDKNAGYILTDLMTGRVIAEGTGTELDGFSVFIPNTYTGVYSLIKK